MKEKKAVTREYQPRCLKASKKEKKTLLDESARLAGRRRKSAARPLSAKPGKKRPASWKGKRVCTGEVIRALRPAFGVTGETAGKPVKI